MKLTFNTKTYFYIYSDKNPGDISNYKTGVYKF